MGTPIEFTHIDFYPRPPRGGRQPVFDITVSAAKFLSTPSARRATVWTLCAEACIEISIHALREEGDNRVRGAGAGLHGISIHALREEGDRISKIADALNELFLSTPSARRATETYPAGGGAVYISIHALREEGDKGRAQNFCFLHISIHALREEGDAGDHLSLAPESRFLYTPSARRATAVLRDGDAHK